MDTLAVQEVDLGLVLEDFATFVFLDSYHLHLVLKNVLCSKVVKCYLLAWFPSGVQVVAKGSHQESNQTHVLVSWFAVLRVVEELFYLLVHLGPLRFLFLLVIIILIFVI